MCYPAGLIFRFNQQNVLHMSRHMHINTGCVLIGLLRSFPAEMTGILRHDEQRHEYGQGLRAQVALNKLKHKTQGELYIIVSYRQNGSCPWLQFLPIRSCSRNSGSKPEVFSSAEILLQAWVSLLMDDLLLLARWTRSSNKCGPIYHPQHITGELGWLFMPAGAWTDLSWVHGLKLWKGRLPHLSPRGG